MDKFMEIYKIAVRTEIRRFSKYGNHIFFSLIDNCIDLGTFSFDLIENHLEKFKSRCEYGDFIVETACHNCLHCFFFISQAQ